MATTNLIPLHPGKDGRMDKAIYRVIRYHKARDQMQQSLTAKANLDLLLHRDKQKKERSYAHENVR